MNISSNPNVFWSQLFVETLAHSGLTAVIISPGSRSTPLTLAFHAQPDIDVHLHLDERGAGFFALGMALAADKPVALVCTSGTAVANYLPAIIEAKMSQVPLLVLTADRPHELRHSGANQTIDQVKIYGDQVLWSVDAALPQANASEVAIRNHQTLAARAYATANGLVKGPVHVNFPFRKPLEPVSREPLSVTRSESRITDYGLRIERGYLVPTPTQAQKLADLITQHPHGLIVCGPRCEGGRFPSSVMQLSQASGYPLLADPLSGVRFHEWKDEAKRINFPVVSGYEGFLQNETDWPEPEVIIRFGQVPTSKWLNAYLDRIQPQHRIHIRENGVWADDSHRTTWFLQADAGATCTAVTALLNHQQINTDWWQTIHAADQRYWQKTEPQLANHWFDGTAVAELLRHLPENTNLLIGNSLPVRHLDLYGRSRPQTPHIFGNRGASGIDGNIATGLGIAAASQRPTYILVGDVTAYHDLNSLLFLKAESRGQKAESKITHHALRGVTLIVLNNDGGNIFRRLPISQHEPPFTDLFLTPHGLTFEHAAQMFDLDYVRVENRETFQQALAQSGSAPRLIEVMTDGRSDHQIQQTIRQST